MLEKVEMTELEATANNVLPIDFGNATSAAAKDGNLKLYTTPELASIFNASTRTIRQWVKEVKLAWDWLAFGEFKCLGKHTQLVHDQIQSLNEFRRKGGTYEGWKTEIQKLRRGQSASAFTEPQQQQSIAIIPHNPSSVKLGPGTELYGLIEQELERQKTDEAYTLKLLESVEAELVENEQAFNQSSEQDTEARRRQVQQTAIRDALADEKDYQAAYIATRNHLRAKKRV